MNTENQPIPRAPIIEAVVDIDCDLPTKLDLESLQEPAAKALHDLYPKFKQLYVQQHVFKQQAGAMPEMETHKGKGAMQFLTEDEKQLIQFRPNGFSFNRLAPYDSFDNYFKEIETRWKTYLELAQPVVIRKIGIRMINRIMLPIAEGKLNFGDFLTVTPRLPDTGSSLVYLGFLDQQMALDPATGNQANIVKTTQVAQGDKLPMILDIDVFHPCEIQPNDWQAIRNRLDSLRSLKNRIFRNTLTPQCLNLFSPQD
jgi:uncharacterized protein (TIGR04255 family)